MSKKLKRTDKQRLDWLTQRCAYVAHSRDGEYCWIVYVYGIDEEGEESRSQLYDSVREAIDREMDEK